ncbi:MAG: thermonuclease family protein [Candidatus Atribacteria bacterium]|nr:thermonuclease family protein [Candidatus Atribacteria bacterium]MCD6349607.1 thermonuclease family protein [Candidatus Atribacteria bacterium]
MVIVFYGLSQHSTEYIVEEVIDGDTIKLKSGERVRYIGIDTPELKGKDGKPEFYAWEAKEANRKLVEGKKVKLEFDVEKRDRYGRLLAYVYVDGLMVNEWLVANGYARAVVFPPNVKYEEHFRRLEDEAQELGLGIWRDITKNAPACRSVFGYMLVTAW